MNKKLIIAIDGPVGSGKGSVAVALAKKLNAFYIYTGGMYRALAYECLRQNINIHSEKEVLKLLKKISLELKVEEYGTVISVNGQEIFDELFLPEVTKTTPIVAAFSRVRNEMVLRQRKAIDNKDVIVEGRDIATEVIPHADLKIYLTADANVRAKRRQQQLKKRGFDVSFEEVLQQINNRDKLDTERKASPLTLVPDAYIIDTTNLTAEQTAEKAMVKLREKRLA